jgi:hypothetical protein
MMFEYTIPPTHPLPGAGESLRLEFPLKRVTRLEVPSHPSAEVDLDTLVVLIPGPMDQGSLPVRCTGEGEVLDAPLASLEPNTPRTYMDPPSKPAHLERLYAARERLGRLCRMQQFLFVLDRESHPGLLQARVIRGELSAEDRAQRMKAVLATTGELMTRVKDRHAGRPPTAVKNKDALGESARIFRVSAACLSPDSGYDAGWSLVGEAMCRFAACDLRTRVLVTGPDEAPAFWPVTQPDSGMITLFAELGSACLENNVHPEMWRQLYPYAIRMQLYYWKQFAPKPRRLGAFKTCELELSFPDRLRIDLATPLTMDRAGLDAVATAELRRMVSSMG